MSIPSNDYRPVSRLDFAWIGEAWRMFTAQPGTWIGAIALYLVISLLVMAVIAVPTGFYAYIINIFRAVQSGAGTTPPAMDPHAQLLHMLPFSIILAVVNAVLYGGLYRMAIRQYRGEQISATGLFSAFDVAFPLIIIALVLAAVEETITYFISNGAWVVSILLTGLFFLAPLRVVDKRVGPVQAFTDTLELLRGQRWLGIFFYLVVSFLSALGTIGCGVGIIATLPLLFLTLGVSYMMMTDPRPPVVPGYGQPMPGVWPPPPNVGQ